MSYICYSRVTDSDETFSTKIAEATACTARIHCTAIHSLTSPAWLWFCTQLRTDRCPTQIMLHCRTQAERPVHTHGIAPMCTAPRTRPTTRHPFTAPPSTAHCRIAFPSVFPALAVKMKTHKPENKAGMAQGRGMEAARRRGPCCARMCLQLTVWHRPLLACRAHGGRGLR